MRAERAPRGARRPRSTGGRGDADALERPHQHPVARQRAQRDEDVARARSRRPRRTTRWPNAIWSSRSDRSRDVRRADRLDAATRRRSDPRLDARIWRADRRGGRRR